MTTQILNALSTTSEPDEDINSSQFFCEYQLNSTELKIAINSVGPIDFPIAETDIQNLLNIADLAKFGLGEKTLQDTNIRNTYEISADKISAQFNNDSMDKMLNEMRSAMGLSENIRLSAHLHNMLIYVPGQFFKIHQDSEKLSNMVATLVIVLPCPHIGGDLVIHHNKKQHRFISENLNNQKLQCVSFYADCHHEIELVKQGYRVALTYNLVVESQDNEQLQLNSQKRDLEIALGKYFDIDQPATSKPLTLTYYLEHEYSEHGLKWELLKGIDIQNAFAFRNAAKNLGLKVHLVLVKLHESWATQYGYDDDPDPVELLNDEVDFTYWLNEYNQVLPYTNFRPSEDEICWTKETNEFEAIETEYEGWMGNYGNTVDYWYRRAAIVLWREKDQIAMEFQLNYSAALANLVNLTQKPNQEATVLDIIEKAGDHIFRSQYHTNLDDFLPFLNLACYIHGANIAQFLLNRFNITMVNSDCVDRMAKLQRLYGVDWCLMLLQHWEKSKSSSYRCEGNLIDKIDLLIVQAVNTGLDSRIILFLLKYQFQQMSERDSNALKRTLVQQRTHTAQRVDASLTLLRACFAFPEAEEIAREWISHLKSYPDLYSVLEVSDIYFSLQTAIPANYQSLFVILREYAIKCIAEELQKGLRKPNDWSIEIKSKCQCRNCKILNEFLRSKIEPKKIWPLVETERTHISQTLADLGLPINYHVEKNGRPYKLVLTKTDQLYQAAKSRFEKLTDYSKKLGIKSK